MPRKGLKVEESRGAGPAEAGNQDENRLAAAGQRVYHGREEVREGTEVVLKLVREREVNLREGLPEIEALEELVLVALQHRGVDELLNVLARYIDKALQDCLHQGEGGAAVVRIHPDTDNP